jgi:hypothetical protein
MDCCRLKMSAELLQVINQKIVIFVIVLFLIKGIPIFPMLAIPSRSPFQVLKYMKASRSFLKFYVYICLIYLKKIIYES